MTTSSAAVGSLAVVVDRTSRPGAVVAAVALVVGTAWSRLGEPTPAAETYAVGVLAAAALALALLVLTAALPHHPQRRVRAAALALAGVVSGGLAGNGLAAGAAQALLVLACLTCLVTALPAVVAQLETGRGRPVGRL